MPTFEYRGDTPGSLPVLSIDGDGNWVVVGQTPVSDPIDYLPVGADSPVVGRLFANGEHVAAVDNPDPSCFTEVSS